MNGRDGGRSTVDLLSHAVSGGAAGAIAAIFVCPLDVVKTILQVYGLPERCRGHKQDNGFSVEKRKDDSKLLF